MAIGWANFNMEIVHALTPYNTSSLNCLPILYFFRAQLNEASFLEEMIGFSLFHQNSCR